MDDIVEFHLSKSVNMTNTTFVRESVARRIKADGLDGPPVELMRFHVFVHCTGGAGQHMVDFENHEMTRGTAIWIRPGQVQQWSNVHDDFEADLVVFESSSVPDLPLFDHLLGATRVTHVGRDVDRLQQQMDWMAADLEANQDQAIAAAVVSVILRLFARHTQSEDEGPDASARNRLATDFVTSIDAHIHQRSVAWHGQQIGASTRSIARATAETLGQRPKQVLDSRVILESRRRLAWSSDDVGAIARALRFSEASNFTKFFRRHTGVSPSEFREAVAQLESAAQH